MMIELIVKHFIPPPFLIGYLHQILHEKISLPVSPI